MAGLQNLDIGITAFDPVVAAVLLLDELGVTATRAYSTRKLRSAYAGSAIRIRRSSDNAEQDIGFSSEDLDTAAITTFVGSNSAYVVTWYDQSGSADNATMATASQQPRIVNAGTLDTRNSKPAPFFDGSDDRNTSASSFTWQTVGAVVAVNAASVFPDYSGVFTATGGGDILHGSSASTVYYPAGSLGSGISVNNTGTSTATFAGALHQVNGTRTAGALSPGGVAGVGSDRDISGRFWPGWIGEIVVFSTDLSSGNDTALYNNQKAYWGTP